MALQNSEAVESLRWKKFPVLDDGFVCLVDSMGDDAAVVQAARVSYGEGTQRVSDDRTLIRYMMRNHHGTPFEMAEVKFLVRVPMDCWRQWIRHRTANVNEYSTRYSEAIDSAQQTPPDQWRLQSATNKQGSGGTVSEWPEGYSWSQTDMPEAMKLMPQDVQDRYGGVLEVTREDGKFQESEATPAEWSPGDRLSREEQRLQQAARRVYEERLRFGVAREQARKDLPLSTYTEAYWKCDLRNILHFLWLRMDSHAQHEIRQYANVIGREIIAKLFPVTWEAFEDYQLGAVTFSRVEIECLKSAIRGGDSGALAEVLPNKREREEFLAKLQRLNLA